jgi:cyclopropane-fatty-acyl-phospholipid synthase
MSSVVGATALAEVNATMSHQRSAEAAEITRGLLTRLFGPRPATLSVRLWDGSVWPDETPRPGIMVLRHPGALRAMFLPGNEVALGEAYLYDDLDVEGSMEAAYAAAEELLLRPPSGGERLRLAADLKRLPHESLREQALRALEQGERGRARVVGLRHSPRRDRQAVTYHYDVSNDFYALWQDAQMIYSCAYFDTPDLDLDVAQRRKLDMICRKLRLRPGQRLLDVGCGWGALTRHAARAYGVDATGITLSAPQAELANARIHDEGLAERCRVIVQDYRALDEYGGYDALVSVGMFEHVGERNLPSYFRRAGALLKPGGVFLNHGIALRGAERWNRGRTFSNAYVFPDGELVPLHVTLEAAELSGFEVRDVESLREHYALTLRHWVRRLEARHEEALRFVSEPTYRVWRLYMSGSVHGFSSGRLNVYQTLLVKPGEGGASGLPLTRMDWYV